MREDATGPQRAGLGSPVRVTGAAHRLQAWVTALTPTDPELADLGTYRKR